MKRLLSISILLIAMFTNQSIISQNESSTFELKRSIKLTEEDTDIQNITLNITEKTVYVGLGISCKVFLGNLKIELYDPNGKKHDEFSVESQIKDKSDGKTDNFYEKETVEGQIEKILNNPIKGNWIVKIIPQGALASIEIGSRFITQN